MGRKSKTEKAKLKKQNRKSKTEKAKPKKQSEKAKRKSKTEKAKPQKQNRKNKAKKKKQKQKKEKKKTATKQKQASKSTQARKKKQKVKRKSKKDKSKNETKMPKQVMKCLAALSLVLRSAVGLRLGGTRSAATPDSPAAPGPKPDQGVYEALLSLEVYGKTPRGLMDESQPLKPISKGERVVVCGERSDKCQWLVEIN